MLGGFQQNHDAAQCPGRAEARAAVAEGTRGRLKPGETRGQQFCELSAAAHATPAPGSRSSRKPGRGSGALWLSHPARLTPALVPLESRL